MISGWAYSSSPPWKWTLSRLVVEPVTEPIARHAAVPLADAGLHGHKHAIDAMLSATALTVHAPVTVLTSDPEDLTALCGARATRHQLDPNGTRTGQSGPATPAPSPPQASPRRQQLSIRRLPPGSAPEARFDASEIVRAGLLSVDHGNVEAAHSLGMSPTYTLRRIVLPQAMRVIIPPMGNETISMLKNTALLQLIAVPELYTQSSWISAQNLRQVELLIVASAWYLVLTSVLSVPQYYLERRYGRGTNPSLPLTPWQRARRLAGQVRTRIAQVAHTDARTEADA